MIIDLDNAKLILDNYLVLEAQSKSFSNEDIKLISAIFDCYFCELADNEKYQSFKIRKRITI